MLISQRTAMSDVASKQIAKAMLYPEADKDKSVEDRRSESGYRRYFKVIPTNSGLYHSETDGIQDGRYSVAVNPSNTTLDIGPSNAKL